MSYARSRMLMTHLPGTAEKRPAKAEGFIWVINEVVSAVECSTAQLIQSPDQWPFPPVYLPCARGLLDWPCNAHRHLQRKYFADTYESRKVCPPQHSRRHSRAPRRGVLVQYCNRGVVSFFVSPSSKSFPRKELPWLIELPALPWLCHVKFLDSVRVRL